MTRIASFNVENLFARAKALNGATWQEGRPILDAYNSMIKFFVLDGLSSGVVAVSPDSAPDSAFAPSFFARPSGPLPSPIIRCSAGLARLKSSIMPSGRAHPQWPGDTDGAWQASPLRECLC
jgi:hypothetical protein